MKTAISIPDEVFIAADDLAERLGVSRSELYSTAVARFLKEMRSEGITARLNAVYATQSSSLDPALLEGQLHVLQEEDW